MVLRKCRITAECFPYQIFPHWILIGMDSTCLLIWMCNHSSDMCPSGNKTNFLYLSHLQLDILCNIIASLKFDTSNTYWQDINSLKCCLTNTLKKIGNLIPPWLTLLSILKDWETQLTDLTINDYRLTH